MRLTMPERRTVTKEYAARYRKAGRKEKGRMLSEFVDSTGYGRVYAAWLLRRHGLRAEIKGRGRLFFVSWGSWARPRSWRSALWIPPASSAAAARSLPPSAA